MCKKLFLTFFCIAYFYISATGQTDTVSIGQSIPVFSLSVDANKTILSSEMRGKIILINFFATWCAPCRAELPELEKNIWNKYKNNSDFQLLVIGRQHTKEEIIAFKKSKAFDLPMYADPEREIYKLFAQQFIPRNYIIDKKGTIIYSSIGYNPDEFNEMEKILSSLLDPK